MKLPLRLSVTFILLLVGTFYLFYDGPDYSVSRSTKELWNLGHIVYFALMVYFLAKFRFLKKVPLPYQWLGFILLSLVLGTLIEVLQYGTQREPDLADISRDLTGCLLVLSFYSPLLKLSSNVSLIFIRLFALTVLLVHMIPLAIALIDETTARYQFPILSNFETAFELDRWEGGASKETIQMNLESDSFQLKIGLTTDRYSGVGMEYLPSDWREYRSVIMEIYQPSDEPISITIRIHDLEHETGGRRYEYDDRFNRSYLLNKGWNEISISLEEVRSALSKRKMDLSQIRDISLFAIRLPEPRAIYLDKIYLSN